MDSQFIVITVDAHNLPKRARTIVGNVNEGLRRLFRQIGDSTTKRMRRNVSAPQPYGTTASTIVRRAGGVYRTIGFRVTRTEDGPYLQMGAIKGSDKERAITRLHDSGGTIVAKKTWIHNGRVHRYLIFPPSGSPARDPATGEQLMTANQTREHFYKQWDMDDKIMVQRNKGDNPVLAFLKRERVTIPARHIISGELAHVRSELARKVPTSIQRSLNLETLRI